jgi:hypothetical protein
MFSSPCSFVAAASVVLALTACKPAPAPPLAAPAPAEVLTLAERVDFMHALSAPGSVSCRLHWRVELARFKRHAFGNIGTKRTSIRH